MNLIGWIVNRFNNWRQRRAFNKLSPAYRKLFTYMGVAPRSGTKG